MKKPLVLLDWHISMCKIEQSVKRNEDNTWFKWAAIKHTLDRFVKEINFACFMDNIETQQWNRIKPVAIFTFCARNLFIRKRNEFWFFSVTTPKCDKTTTVRWFHGKNRQKPQWIRLCFDCLRSLSKRSIVEFAQQQQWYLYHMYVFKVLHALKCALDQNKVSTSTASFSLSRWKMNWSLTIFWRRTCNELCTQCSWFF